MRFRTTIRARKNSAVSNISAVKPSAAAALKGAAVLPWIAQVLLAALLLCAVGKKVVLPLESLTSQSHPGLFMKFIGLAEVLGDRPDPRAGSEHAAKEDDAGGLQAGK